MTPATEKAAPIPADVLALAEDAIRKCYAASPYDVLRFDYALRLVDAVARAILADREARPSLPDSREERIRAEARAKCLADVDYIRENIRHHETPSGRKRFDIYDLDRTLRNTCTLIRERITGEDEGKWTDIDPADAARARQGGNNG